jgi:hypothetical protein
MSNKLRLRPIIFTTDKMMTIGMLLVLFLSHNLAFADSQFTVVNKINWEVNQAFEDVPNNCLIVAKEKRRQLEAYGINANIVVIHPAYSFVKHAVLCVGNQCLDNGDITSEIFNANELGRYSFIN